MQITITKCVKGKKHEWETVASKDLANTFHEWCWCQQCGSLVEFVSTKPSSRRRVANTSTGTTSLRVPGHLA